MAQPNTSTFDNESTIMSAASSTSLFGGTTLNSSGALPPVPQPPSLSSSASHLPDAGSPASSDNTYIMPNTPARSRSTDGYRPKVVRTMGQRPACLVNASVTYCGNNQIYAFGGFDQYTDEVYNHVLKLDLATNQWNLVDNYGDIPGVRMGHTATLYKGDQLLVFGGENELAQYLNDLVILDLKTARWTQPQLNGPIPKGRARHAAVLHEDKLFIIGGLNGQRNHVLDDICYLDLKTFTWSKTWRFVGRFDHSAHIWGERVWVFGGLGEDMEKVSDLWWLDLKNCPEFDVRPQIGMYDSRSGSGSRAHGSPRTASTMSPPSAVGTSGYAANSRTAQVNPPSVQLRSYAPIAPGTISAVKFVSGNSIPSQGLGVHYHAYASGTLLDFVTPAAMVTHREGSLSALDLNTLRWQKLAEGREIFKAGYRWHYCTMNEDGTKAWLLGCPTEAQGGDPGMNEYEEYLSDIMEVDLRRYGFLGNSIASEPVAETKNSALRRAVDPPSQGLGGDLAKLFDQPPETGSGTDFVITALAGGDEDEEALGSVLVRVNQPPEEDSWLPSEDTASPATSKPIHVHKLILQARWPHFARLYNAQMAEFHTKKMHIPEPYSVVKAFLYYLYTDNISGVPSPTTTSLSPNDIPTDLSDVAGLLVMSNIYHIPHLRLLTVNRLAKELDVEHACVIWYCSGLAQEEWLRKRAAVFCMTHWGRIVRTQGFLRLPRAALVELSQEIDTEGRVVGGEELEYGRGGGGYDGREHAGRKESMSSEMTQVVDSEVDEEDGMEMT